MDDRCLVCIMSHALGNAGKGCLEQPKELKAESGLGEEACRSG